MKHYVYIDESGSINRACIGDEYFVVALLYVRDKEKLKLIFKRFINKNINSLKKLDKADKMFTDEKFVELKGSALNTSMKRRFLKFFAQNNLFKVIYIKVHNSSLESKFCENSARSFNYLIRKTTQVLFDKKVFEQGDYFLHIDERNIRTDSRRTLEDYLNTELRLNLGYESNFKIQYFDSCNNKLIQIADVLSNIFYSSIYNRRLKEDLEKIRRDGYIPLIFKFPLNGHR